MPTMLFILDSFSHTMEKLSLDEKSTLELIQIHQNLNSISLQTLLSQLNSLAALLRGFALSLESFRSLSARDQDVLLESNIPLYLQYITGRYLTSDSGLEQLNWILEGNLPPVSPEEVYNLAAVSFEQYVWEQFHHRTSELFGMYSDYLLMLKVFFSFPQYFNGMIANMILFYTSESTKKELNEPQKVEALFCEAKKLLERELEIVADSDTSFKLSAFAFVLSQMKNVFGYLQDSGTMRPTAPKVSRQCISFTETEESWLSHKFERMQLQFRTVVPSQKMTQTLLKVFLKQQDVSPENSEQWAAMVKERVKRMLIDQPEFQDLSRGDQNSLMRKSIGSATMISILQANSAKTGKAQLKNFVGYLDPENRSWEAGFRSIVDLDELGLIPIHKSSPLGRKLSDSQTAFITQLLKDVSELFSCDQNFLFLFLLTFSDTDGLPTTPAFQSISDLHKLYLRFFQQKLSLRNSPLSDPQLLSTALNKLKILTRLFQTYVIEGFQP